MIGAPEVLPLSKAKAMTELENVIAPMATPLDTGAEVNRPEKGVSPGQQTIPRYKSSETSATALSRRLYSASVST